MTLNTSSMRMSNYGCNAHSPPSSFTQDVFITRGKGKYLARGIGEWNLSEAPVEKAGKIEKISGSTEERIQQILNITGL